MVSASYGYYELGVDYSMTRWTFEARIVREHRTTCSIALRYSITARLYTFSSNCLHANAAYILFVDDISQFVSSVFIAPKITRFCQIWYVIQDLISQSSAHIDVVSNYTYQFLILVTSRALISYSTMFLLWPTVLTLEVEIPHNVIPLPDSFVKSNTMIDLHVEISQESKTVPTIN